jgi:hypothetical protein
MRLENRLAWLSLTFVAAACGGGAPAGDDVAAGRASSAIVGGLSDDGDHTVGMVFRSDTKQLCTGTLIAPYVVLTAAHCVDDVRTTPITPTASSNVTFYTGLASGLGGESGTYNPAADPSVVGHSVGQILLAPNFTLNAAQTGCPNDHDVALLQLDSVPRVGELPRPYATSAADLPPPPAAATAIGYGMSEGGAVGVRKSGTSVIESLTQGAFGDALVVAPFPGIERPGDEGGPLLYAGMIVGVAMCTDLSANPIGWYSRVDEVAPWITATLQQWAGARDGACDARCGTVERACVGAGGAPCACMGGYASCMTGCTGRLFVNQCTPPIDPNE